MIDTSAALKWVVAEPGSDVAAALIPRALMAPELFQTEIGNALTKKVRGDQLSAEQARLGFRMIMSRVSLVPAEPFGEVAFEHSLSLHHSIYDCYFLATAEKHGRLVTADRLFAAKVRATRYAYLIHLLGEDIPDD